MSSTLIYSFLTFIWEVTSTMSSNLEARKLSILEYLVELEDEAIIQQIERLLKPKIDFWEELSATQQQSIQRGSEQLKNGQRTEYNSFIAKYKSRKLVQA